MKAAEYGSMIMLMFIKNIDHEYCDSIQQVILLTDALAKKFKFDPGTLSYMTKYLIIQYLASSKILVIQKSGVARKVKLAAAVKNYVRDKEK